MPVIWTKNPRPIDEDGGAEVGAGEHLAQALRQAQCGSHVQLVLQLVELARDVGGRVDLGHDPLGLGASALHDVPAGGVGEAQQQERDDHSGDGSEAEQPAPGLTRAGLGCSADDLGEHHRDDVAEDDAGHRRDLVEHEQGTPDGGGSGLGHEDRDDHDRDTDREAQQEARHHEARDVPGESGREGEERVGGGDADHDGLAAEAVGEDAADKRAGDLAKDDDRSDEARLGLRQVVRLPEVEERAADVGGVIAVDDADGRRRDGDEDAQAGGTLQVVGEAHAGLLRSGSADLANWSTPIESGMSHIGLSTDWFRPNVLRSRHRVSRPAEEAA